MRDCPGCGAPFDCAMTERDCARSGAACWCGAMPPLPAAAIAALAEASGERCLCPACLNAAIAGNRPAPAVSDR